MNCTHCGKKLYPEAPFCPHCGKPNENRIRLENDVNAFSRDYDRTTDDVRRAVTRKNRFIGKIVAIVFLVLLLVLSFLFLQEGASTLAYSLRRQEMEQQIDGLLVTENAYLDAQDYFGLRAWFDAGYSEYDIAGAAPGYTRVGYVVRSYCNCMGYLMEYRSQLVTSDYYYDSVVSRARSVRDSVAEFYRCLDRDYSDTPQERTDAVEQMRSNIEAALVAYFAVPPEEAASLQTLSDGARGMLLEQYVQAPPDRGEPARHSWRER